MARGIGDWGGKKWVGAVTTFMTNLCFDSSYMTTSNYEKSRLKSLFILLAMVISLALTLDKVYYVYFME